MSTIDATKPVSGTPTTSSVRANFLAAKNEIDAIEARTVTALTGLTGGGTLGASFSISFDTTWGDARYLTGNQTITYTGDVTGSGTTAVTLTVASVPEAVVTVHQAALSITESQISDLGTYATDADLTAEENARTAADLLLLPRNSDTTVDATTSRTLASTDEGDDVVFSSASAVTVTIPGTLAVGFQCSISQVGAGAVTLTSADNLNGAGSDITLPAQWTTVWLLQYSEGNWLVSGA